MSYASTMMNVHRRAAALLTTPLPLSFFCTSAKPSSVSFTMDHSPPVFVDPADRPVIATADDALTAKQATVATGYYEDPFLDMFAKSPLRMVQPIIKRGTHARVACIDRAIVSFCNLYSGNCQIVVLGAGMDTSFLRSGLLGVSPTAWFEVDHSSVVLSKAHIIAKNADKLNVSVAMDGTDFTIRSSTSTCQCIGYDLREAPSELFVKLTNKGFDTEVPTLFLLECVQMYLPEDASRALLSQLVTSCKHASVVVYDPIAQYDAFGEVMEKHLVSAGMAAAHTSLLQTRTLEHQLDKLTSCGFEIAVGCDMWLAYETILSGEQRVRANRCELLDELEEWKMLMQHYCLAVGSSMTSGFCEVGASSPMGFLKKKCTVSLKQQS